MVSKILFDINEHRGLFSIQRGKQVQLPLQKLQKQSVSITYFSNF